MFIESKYIMNPNFMCMVGIYDRNAKLCSLVRETNRMFLVDRSPLQLLDDSIKCIGFDLRGAMSTSKCLLSHKHMCPVMVNPIHNICVFPNKSAKHNDTMWFNPAHISRTYSINQMTLVEFTNGTTLLTPSKLYSFNSKLQTAEQFRNMIDGTAHQPAQKSQEGA